LQTYVESDYTTAERRVLSRHFTSVDGPAAALTHLPDATRAALFARYSRTAKPLKRVFLDEFYREGEDSSETADVGVARASDLFSRVLSDYGDDSVAQLAGVHVSCEQVSNLLTKVLERGRLMGYLEQSTRYVYYGDRPGGRYRYYRDPDLFAGPHAQEVEAALDGLFDAYASAAGARVAPDQSAVLSLALETLADLGVVELGTEEGDGSLTVALSPLGTWGVHRRLRAQGWHVPVLGAARRDGALGLLAALANCDAEDGEAEITTWLGVRTPATAAAELIDAAATGSPGQRGAAFTVLDRIGLAGQEQVRSALERPLLRAHAAVWLIEHGEDVQLNSADRTWLLVDLGAGLLEEANAQDVVAELLPDLPPEDQADIVARLWQVRHPGVTEFLTALSDHHPDQAVARAARKAAFKARSPAASAD